jgi:hypothetical protein
MSKPMKTRMTITDKQSEEAAIFAIQQRESLKARSRPDRKVTAAAGENAANLAHSLKLMRLEPVNLADAMAVQERIAEYFAICLEDDERSTVAGLALAFGVDRRRLWEIQAGKTNKPKAVQELIQRAYQVINAQLESLMYSGKTNPIPAIFLLKANFQYEDTHKIEIAPAQSDDSVLSPEEIVAQLEAAPVVDYGEDAM